MIKTFVFDAYGTLYDVQSVADVTDRAFPGHGEIITQIWRMKQLEYSWLRSLMNDYRDFWTVTREALTYTLSVLGLTPSATLFDDIAEAYNRLTPYPDAVPALVGLSGARRAILSNGSPHMLDALVGGSDLRDLIETTISVDEKRVFKPDPRAYELVEERLGVKPHEVVFVSSNGFDIAGAKRFGFRVARIVRVPPAVLVREISEARAGTPGALRPTTLYKALRTQEEALGHTPDFVIASLADLSRLAA
ncbi:haloacid dehalogenase type II [Xanthobacter autotrophicus]|uniref:haloacid dehalogenase type II n=1 Tax=Xanthobacter TaxID=279 RepID=UPI0024AAC8FC|nr:haloacid dehalogenase type II [Xanthobacter autotrophicus]MDI4663543.1 haloacid dehalogenase type II [Xanthobacter autotrophicus]